MKVFKEKGGCPVKHWAPSLDETTMAQAVALSHLPFAFKHIALMPDSHAGYGMPIGGVLASKDAIVPNAVGFDGGCGMCAVRTSLFTIDTESLETICAVVKRNVPVGFAMHDSIKNKEYMPEKPKGFDFDTQKAEYQLGTLGGGNHFIEIQKGADGGIWIMIHSGSRKLGHTVATKYTHIAKELNSKYYSTIPLDLAHLPLHSNAGKDYLRDMRFCLDYAEMNRFIMMREVKRAFNDVLGDVVFGNTIDVCHNYARMENHFGHNVIVHRKGATSAREGEFGIIPGSQGSKSFIVRGLGNPESFSSCSHGAGRAMGRKQAQRELSLKEQQDKLNAMGVVHSMNDVSDLDEAPDAYKDITKVMEQQQDLVEIFETLTPLAVIKG